MNDFCVRCLYEDYDGAEEPCINCVRDKDEYPTEFFPKRPPKPTTKADLIRQMSDEELAKHICCPYGQCIDLDRPCSDCIRSWLKSPVEVEG